MSNITLSSRNGDHVIVIKGQFTFDSNQAFRNAYKSIPPSQPITVDLSSTDYLDSAGLGMLVRLREYAGNAVTLRGPNPTVRNILEIANFGRIFTIV
ncbi:MAG: STAS domain-containing protein [Gammaproteobacteria bacterium]|nr:STAS domain-containing protein [Gammaproteobacteria bacterium]MCB1922683.1 STAS domain-containing protein [Gammaproteobacteria bacterium]